MHILVAGAANFGNWEAGTDAPKHRTNATVSDTKNARKGSVDTAHKLPTHRSADSSLFALACITRSLDPLRLDLTIFWQCVTSIPYPLPPPASPDDGANMAALPPSTTTAPPAFPSFLDPVVFIPPPASATSTDPPLPPPPPPSTPPPSASQGALSPVPAVIPTLAATPAPTQPSPPPPPYRHRRMPLQGQSHLLALSLTPLLLASTLCTSLEPAPPSQPLPSPSVPDSTTPAPDSSTPVRDTAPAPPRLPPLLSHAALLATRPLPTEAARIVYADSLQSPISVVLMHPREVTWGKATPEPLPPPSPDLAVACSGSGIGPVTALAAYGTISCGAAGAVTFPAPFSMVPPSSPSSAPAPGPVLAAAIAAVPPTALPLAGAPASRNSLTTAPSTLSPGSQPTKNPLTSQPIPLPPAPTSAPQVLSTSTSSSSTLASRYFTNPRSAAYAVAHGAARTLLIPCVARIANTLPIPVAVTACFAGADPRSALSHLVGFHLSCDPQLASSLYHLQQQARGREGGAAGAGSAGSASAFGGSCGGVGGMSTTRTGETVSAGPSDRTALGPPQPIYHMLALHPGRCLWAGPAIVCDGAGVEEGRGRESGIDAWHRETRKRKQVEV